MRRIEKVLVHFNDFVRKPIDPMEVYFLEAVGEAGRVGSEKLIVIPVMLPPLDIISFAPTSEIESEIIVPKTPASIRMLLIKCG